MPTINERLFWMNRRGLSIILNRFLHSQFSAFSKVTALYWVYIRLPHPHKSNQFKSLYKGRKKPVKGFKWLDSSWASKFFILQGQFKRPIQGQLTTLINPRKIRLISYTQVLNSLGSNVISDWRNEKPTFRLIIGRGRGGLPVGFYNCKTSTGSPGKVVWN